MSVCWAVLVEEYCRFLEAGGRRPGTVRQHRMQLAPFARLHPDAAAVMEVDLLDYLSRQRWKPETRKAARSVLRTFYAWMVRTRRMAESPAADLPTVRVPAGAPHPTPTRTFEQALEVADDRTRLMLLLGAYAGLRRTEIATVHPARDIADGILHVEGKGGRSRTVPLHPLLSQAIGDELDRRASGGIGSGWRYWTTVSPHGFLFPGLQPGTHASPYTIGQALTKVLGHHQTAHGLRHRFASRAYAANRDLRAVQELLGHSKPETTMRYTAVPDGAKLAAVMAL